MSVGIIDPNATYALGLSMLVERCGLGRARVWHRVADAARSLGQESAELLVVSEKVMGEFEASALAGGGAALILVVNGEDVGQLAKLRSVGFEGLLLRDAPEDRIASCLRTVASGHAWLDPELCNRIVHPQHADWRCLSKRELEIARLAADGLSNKHIARALNLSDGTVKIHLHHVFAKLHVGKRSELARVLGAQAGTARGMNSTVHHPIPLH